MKTQLVRKILEARAIQKGLIENEVIQHENQENKIQRKAKPVIEAIEDSGNKNVSAITQSLPALTQNQVSQIRHSLTQESTTDEPWIQQLYRQFRHPNKCKSTQFEINIPSGVLGLKGQVDVPMLVNENVLKVKIIGKQDIINNNLTPGLVALLLLPFDDIRKSNITPTEGDITTYVDIISKVGFSSINSKKYQAYIKSKLPAQPQYRSRSTVISSESEDDVFESAQQQMHDLSLEEKRGKGLMFYNNPKELEEKLMLMVGSLKAGNTSAELNKNIRSILDEMQSVNYITLKQHRLLYNKLSLV